MQWLQRRRAQGSAVLGLILSMLGSAAVLGGCASPGPPRPPSLHIPRQVSGLSAMRSGDAVEIQFRVPSRTTDDQPIGSSTLMGRLCRQVGNGACVAVEVPAAKTPLDVPRGEGEPVVWTDRLPETLVSGAPRLIGYRVEVRDEAGRTAGFSDAVYTVAGAAPPAVAGLRATGTRLGVALQWAPVQGGGEVLLERQGPAVAVRAGEVGADEERPRPRKREAQNREAQNRLAAPMAKSRNPERPGLEWLQADPGDASAAATMDGSVEPGVAYTYRAERRQTVTMGGRRLEVRSAPSAPVSVVWRDVYPPAAPQGLTALGFRVPTGAREPGAPGEGGAYAVDLVWEPVNDARLAGYLVYRQTLNAAGEAVGTRMRLTEQPVLTPGYHDATAQPGERYRYSVTAIDPKGNESAAADAVVEPQAGP